MGSNANLIKEIERVRAEMTRIIKKYGYSCEKSITISQELDRLLNEYYKGLENKS